MKNKFFLVLVLISSYIAAMENPEIQVVPPLLKTFKMPGAINSKMVYTPNGEFLIANVRPSQTKNIMKIIKTNGYTDVTDIDMPSSLDFITDVSPDSQYVLTANELHALRQWNINIEDSTGLPHTQEAGNAKYDRTGKRLLFSNPSGTYILDLTSNEIIKSLVSATYNSADFSWHPTNPDQIGISTLGQDWQNSQWGIWDLVADKVRTLTTVPVQTTGTLTFSKDGNSLLATAVDQCVQCDTKTAALTYYALNGAKSSNPIKGNNKSLYASQFLKRDPISFYAGSDKNTVVYCDTDDTAKSFTFTLELDDTIDTIYAMAMNADGSRLAVPSEVKKENVIKIFDVSAQTRFVTQRARYKALQEEKTDEVDLLVQQAAFEQSLGLASSQLPQISHNLGCALT